MRAPVRGVLAGALLAAVSAACSRAVAAPPAGPAVAVDAALMKTVVAVPFDEVELIVRTELQARNLNIIGTLDVQRALAGRDVAFPPYKVIQFCNLQDGLALFENHPDYGAFIPCSLLLYEKDGRTVVAGRRPTAIARGLPGHVPSAQAVAVAERVEALMREVLDAVVEEAKALPSSPTRPSAGTDRPPPPPAPPPSPARAPTRAAP